MAFGVICVLCFLSALPYLNHALPRNSHDLEEVPVSITVINDFSNEQVSYSTSVIEDGLMFGALNNLQDTNRDFKFTYLIHPSFGIYLESVNGVAGSEKDQTYWEILSEIGDVITPLEAGIGCYQPKKNENLILRFTTWAAK